ncbi:MAG: hypothetical protein CMD30_03540 [Flavobacteriales bacterium]|mgnify:CR=1 FL=1|nr:hypothetical protein [Flavobacteriales bacterium]
MNKYIKKSKLDLFFGIFFIASISADPLLHDHIDEHQSESIVECQLCENKAFDHQHVNCEVSELIQISFLEELTPDNSSLKNKSNYLSRAPPKK